MQTRFLTWFNKPTSTPQKSTILRYCTILPIQVKDTMILMNPHQAITPLKMFPLQDFSLGDNTLLMTRVYPNSYVFIIIICLQQDSLFQRVDYTIEN
jgi:hypothetical protein